MVLRFGFRVVFFLGGGFGEVGCGFLCLVEFRVVVFGLIIDYVYG